MSDKSQQDKIIERLENRLNREKLARRESERLLEAKSLELYQANKKLHEEARLLEETVVNAKDGVMITDADLVDGPHIIYVNKAFTQMTGYSADEVIGKTPGILQGPDTDRDMLDDIKKKLGNGRSFQGEIKNYSKSGRAYWLDISITPVKDENGEITHFTAIERDITIRKMYESELQRSKKRADAASTAKSDFLATMSHELRTPMNGMIGLSELLLDLNLDEEGQEIAKTINGSAQNLLELINDILDFSKIEANEFSLEMHSFEIKELIKNSIGFLRHLAQEKGLDFRVDLDLDLPDRIFNDWLRIRQVLNNLIGNAIKFTDKGGVNVSIMPEPLKNPTHIKFIITDTGIGIPPEKIGIVFNKFETLEGRNFGGTGLGLAISQQLVDMMKGEIGVSSAYGAGTTFWFTVEANLEKVDTQTASPPQHNKNSVHGGTKDETSLLEGLRILSVDDHPTNLMMMSKMLKKLGAAVVVEAAEGMQAVEKFNTHGPFDLIVMDYHMPRMDGLETTKAIRKIEAQKGETGIPIIAVTADAMKETQEKCLAAGMNDYLSKPIVRHRLVNVLARHLNCGTAENNAAAPALQGVPVQDNRPTPVDLDHLRQFTDGDPQEEKEFFDIFLEQAGMSVTSLEDYIRDENDGEWKKTAHRLKGAAANLGANALSALCADAEKQADMIPEEKEQLLAMIHQELATVGQFIRTLHR